jgi:hypothetical protein
MFSLFYSKDKLSMLYFQSLAVCLLQWDVMIRAPIVLLVLHIPYYGDSIMADRGGGGSYYWRNAGFLSQWASTGVEMNMIVNTQADPGGWDSKWPLENLSECPRNYSNTPTTS